MRRFGGLLLVALTVSGCSHPLGEAEYRRYVQDPAHGLTHTREIGPATIACSYRPADLLVAQELATSRTPASVDSLRQVYAGKTYFSLSLSQQGTEIENQFVTNPTAFTQALSYLSNGIAQDVYLVTRTAQPDSVAALAALYPRQYGSTGRSTILLVFATQRLDLREGFTLSYHDTHFNLGTVRFAFLADDLADLPTLAF